MLRKALRQGKAAFEGRQKEIGQGRQGDCEGPEGDERNDDTSHAPRSLAAPEEQNGAHPESQGEKTVGLGQQEEYL